MNGTIDKIKGRVKEAVGALTNDQKLKKEGKLDQATGVVKDGWNARSIRLETP